MPQPPAEPPESQIPLVVDLDGTLIKTDLLWESLARLFRRNPFSLFAILFWWTRGRAFLKQQLARRVKIDPATLPFNEPFLRWLREQKSAGRKIILATASDLQMARPVADYAAVFDEVLGSDGKTNLRSGNKLKVLVQKFGERGFDYAGNSAADLAVWRGAREAIVVNASRSVAKQAAACAKPGAELSGLFSVWNAPEFSQRTLHPERLSRGHRRRTVADRRVSENRHRRFRVDCSGADDFRRAWKKFWRRLPGRLRRRHSRISFHRFTGCC